jgi:hypothetical protein
MLKILLFIIGIVALFCLLGAITCLLAGPRERQPPNIENIKVIDEVV